jgi:hypothetical protein
MLVGKPLENRPLTISRMKWEDGIKVERREMGYEDATDSGSWPVMGFGVNAVSCQIVSFCVSNM